MSDSVQPHKQQPTRLPCPWDSPGKNTGVGCHCLLSLDDPNIVGNIQSIIVKSHSNICLLLSIRPDHSFHFGHVSVTELLHSLFNLMLIGLDLHDEHSVLLSVFSMADPVVGGSLMMAVWSSLFLLGAPLKIFGLPPEPQCFGPAEGG